MSHTATSAVTGILIFAATIWVGGLFTIAVVARAASGTLDSAVRVEFFRSLGRSYGVVGTSALAVGYGAGAALLYGRSWSGPVIAVAVTAGALAAGLCAGVVQARRMTRLRLRALDAETDDLSRQVRRGARRAGALRGVIALLSLALLALGIAVGS